MFKSKNFDIAPIAYSMYSFLMRVLGIDPGSISTGFGIIEQISPTAQSCIACGAINVKQHAWPIRLKYIFDGVKDIINNYKPTAVGIEKVFVGKNAATALKLGQARGAALVAALETNLIVGEYTPRVIKLTTVGYGAATKTQMQHMVKVLLSLKNKPQQDAADALAVAMCHSLYLLRNNRDSKINRNLAKQKAT